MMWLSCVYLVVRTKSPISILTQVLPDKVLWIEGQKTVVLPVAGEALIEPSVIPPDYSYQVTNSLVHHLAGDNAVNSKSPSWVVRGVQ